MVNVHEKYPEGAVNKAAYSTDGSNVRDATEEEKIRYRDANKHRRKKVDEKSSSSEPSHSCIAVQSVEISKARPASTRTDRGGGGASSANRSGVSPRAKERECPAGGERHGSAHDSKDRGSSREEMARESRTPAAATTGNGEPDEEEMDRRNMAEIQGRIEARRAAKNFETAREMILQLKTSSTQRPAVETRSTRGSQDGDKKEGEKKTGSARGPKKVPVTSPATTIVVVETVGPTDAMPIKNTTGMTSVGEVISAEEPKRSRSGKRATVERHADDALATLKFTAIAESRSHVEKYGGDALEVELGIAFVAGALGKKY